MIDLKSNNKYLFPVFTSLFLARFSKDSILSGLQLMAGHKRELVDNKSDSIKTDSIGGMIRYIKDF